MDDARIGAADSAWKARFAVFISGQALSLFGSSLVQYAIMWHITLTTRSGVMMTLSVLFGFVPTLLLSPFAGVWADRFDRRKLIVLSDAFIALVTLALALLFASGHSSVWLLLIAQGLRSLGAALQGPAVGAIIPQIVPEEKLTRANALNGTVQSALFVVSPIAAGALLSLVPLFSIFFIDVGTAALAIVTFLAFLKVPPHAKAGSPQTASYFADMKDGFRYIRDHRYLISFFVYMALLYIFVSPAAFLTPLQVARRFGPDVWRLTAIELAFSGGMTLGGVAVAASGGFKNRIHTMLAATFVMGVCALSLGFLGNFWPYLGAMAVFGLVIPNFNTPSTVLLQEHVEEAYLGRVFSVLTMLSTSVMPLAMLLFGPLAELVPIESILLATGALLLLMVPWGLGNRRLIEAGIPAIRGERADEASPAGSASAGA
jgi:DHA3 family macrolide efflux protein-like MFS transporter